MGTVEGLGDPARLREEGAKDGAGVKLKAREARGDAQRGENEAESGGPQKKRNDRAIRSAIRSGDAEHKSAL